MALPITITDAGRAEIINADNTGTGPVVIAEIGFGAAQYTPSKTQTALQAPVKRVASIAGQVVAADTVHVMAKDETADAYNVGEFGLFSGKGTLIAVFSQPSASGWIIQKASASTLLLATDIILESLNATSLTFGDVTFTNPPATTTTPGVVQLNNTLTSTSTSQALTAAMGKKLQDEKQHKATTLDGYGITDALKVGAPSNQHPILTAPAPGRAVEGGGALEIREQGLVADTDQAFPRAPSLVFHWSNVVIRDLAMDAEGALRWNSWLLWHAGNFDPAAKADTATTLAGYGITDALKVSAPSQQRPVLAAPSPGGVGAASACALEVREAQLTGSTYAADQAYAPRILFNWSNVVATDLALTINGDLALGGNVLWSARNFDPATKADKATSLEGYGIIDALKIAVGHTEQRRVSLSAPDLGGSDGSGAGGAIEVREAALAGAASGDFQYAPRIVFHWAGLIARALGMDSIGQPRWNNDVMALLSNVQLLSYSFTTPNGHVRLSDAMGGFMLQWCEGPVAGAETVAYAPITFPVPFPNNCLFAGSFTRVDGGVQPDQIFQTVTWTRLDVTLFPQWFGTGSQGLVRPLIFALGN